MAKLGAHTDSPSWRRCMKCNRFVSYKDIEEGKCEYTYVPDTPFTTELENWSHKACP